VKLATWFAEEARTQHLYMYIYTLVYMD